MRSKRKLKHALKPRSGSDLLTKCLFPERLRNVHNGLNAAYMIEWIMQYSNLPQLPLQRSSRTWLTSYQHHTLNSRCPRSFQPTTASIFWPKFMSTTWFPGRHIMSPCTGKQHHQHVELLKK